MVICFRSVSLDLIVSKYLYEVGPLSFAHLGQLVPPDNIIRFKVYMIEAKFEGSLEQAH